MSPTILPDQPPVEREAVLAGRLPARYDYRLQDVFLQALLPRLRPGISILDVGAGRSPTVAPEMRPPGCRYVGLDISAEELEAAGPSAYDEVIAADITRPFSLSEPVDLVISWQVLEHVRPIDAAFANLHGVLRPGGSMLVQLSGSNAVFAVVSRLIPHRASMFIMTRLLGHHEEEKFPTRYDRCSAPELERMLAGWSDVELTPFYRGATYFNMSRALQRGYLVYEDAIARRGARRLATHYLVSATRPAS